MEAVYGQLLSLDIAVDCGFIELFFLQMLMLHIKFNTFHQLA